MLVQLYQLVDKNNSQAKNNSLLDFKPIEENLHKRKHKEVMYPGKLWCWPGVSRFPLILWQVCHMTQVMWHVPIQIQLADDDCETKLKYQSSW